MREINIAMAVIEQEGVYHLQLRNGDKRIGAAGLIGCFGGKIETGETAIDAVCRELAEETNLYFSKEQVNELGFVHVRSDHNLEEVQVNACAFLVKLNAGTQVIAKEGHLISLRKNELRKNIKKMTPGTQACFEKFIEL